MVQLHSGWYTQLLCLPRLLRSGFTCISKGLRFLPSAIWLGVARERVMLGLTAKQELSHLTARVRSRHKGFSFALGPVCMESTAEGAYGDCAAEAACIAHCIITPCNWTSDLMHKYLPARSMSYLFQSPASAL